VPSSTLATVVAPALAAHASQIATLAAGNWQAGNSDVDLYLRAGDDGSVQLWFPTAGDPRPSATYPYTRLVESTHSRDTQCVGWAKSTAYISP
jgi:hypothetical protein